MSEVASSEQRLSGSYGKGEEPLLQEVDSSNLDSDFNRWIQDSKSLIPDSITLNSGT